MISLLIWLRTCSRLPAFRLTFVRQHFWDGRLKTSSNLSGHTFSSLSFERLFYVSDYLILRAAFDDKVIHIYFEISANLFMKYFVHQTLPLYASKKHLKGNPHRDSSFQSISVRRFPSGLETIAHSSGTMLLLFRVITHPSTRSLSIPRLKQCLYSIFEADPPSTYMRCMQWPHISASMIIGPSVPSSSPRGGKRISGLGEKL
ncbi:hypothetical protein Tco_1521121, partial [Tanacetum coccineum]